MARRGFTKPGRMKLARLKAASSDKPRKSNQETDHREHGTEAYRRRGVDISHCIRPRADFDRRQHSRDLLDRRRVAVQVGGPTRKRWRGENEICYCTGGKGECFLVGSLGNRAHAIVEPLDLGEQWRITIRPWSDEIGRAGIGRVLVD